MKLCVLSSPTGWHYRDLKRAAGNDHVVDSFSFENLSATVDSHRFQGVDCGVSEMPSGQTAEQLESYDCIYARAMPAGSLQQVVFRMDVLLELERRGMRIVNPPRCIEASVDKYLALTKLAAAGIPIPLTAVSQSVRQALSHFQSLGSDVVVKPLFGSMGNGLVRVTDMTTAKEVFEKLISDQQVIYQQAFINHGGSDLRLLVIGRQVLAMKRTNHHHWITNIAQGGIGSPHHPSSHESQLALSAAQAVGATIAGIDLIYDSESERPMVLETNSSPSWRALGEVLDIDVSRLVLQELSTTRATNQEVR